MKQKEKAGLPAKKIIDVFLSSEIMTDIVMLFRGNPHLIVNGNHIASRVGRNLQSVEKDLKRLVKLGILRIERSGRQNWFGFDAEKDSQIQIAIETYIRDYKGTNVTGKEGNKIKINKKRFSG